MVIMLAGLRLRPSIIRNGSRTPLSSRKDTRMRKWQPPQTDRNSMIARMRSRSRVFVARLSGNRNELAGRNNYGKV